MATLIVLSLFGVAIAVLGYFGPGVRLFTNSPKGARALRLGFLVWLFALSATVTLFPDGHGGILAWLCWIWSVLGGFAWAIYQKRHGGYVPPLDILDKPVLVRYWSCYIRAPQIARAQSTFKVDVGLSEQLFDITSEAAILNDRDALERYVRDTVNLQPSAFDEAPMVEGAGLTADTTMTLDLYAPAFKAEPSRQQITIAGLLKRPARVVVFAEYAGRQFVRAAFVDSTNTIRGDMTIPIRISDRFPLLPAWLFAVLKVVGEVIAVVSALFLLARGIIPYLKR